MAMKTMETTITSGKIRSCESWIVARKERLTNLLEGCFAELDELIAGGIQSYRARQNKGSSGEIGWEAAREEWMRLCWPEWVRVQRRVAVANAIRGAHQNGEVRS